MSLRNALIRLLEEVDAEFAPPLSQRLSIPAYVDKMIANAVILPLFECGELLAFVGMYCNDPTRRKAYISMVATSADGRGKGIASSLVNHAIAFAGRSGFDELSLEVYRSNTAALNLYRKLGFVVSGENEQSLFLGFPLKRL